MRGASTPRRRFRRFRALHHRPPWARHARRPSTKTASTAQRITSATTTSRARRGSGRRTRASPRSSVGPTTRADPSSTVARATRPAKYVRPATRAFACAASAALDLRRQAPIALGSASRPARAARWSVRISVRRAISRTEACARTRAADAARACSSSASRACGSASRPSRVRDYLSFAPGAAPSGAVASTSFSLGPDASSMPYDTRPLPKSRGARFATTMTR